MTDQLTLDEIAERFERTVREQVHPDFRLVKRATPAGGERQDITVAVYFYGSIQLEEGHRHPEAVDIEIADVVRSLKPVLDVGLDQAPIELGQYWYRKSDNRRFTVVHIGLNPSETISAEASAGEPPELVKLSADRFRERFTQHRPR